LLPGNNFRRFLIRIKIGVLQIGGSFRLSLPHEHRHNHFSQRRLDLINSPLPEILIVFPCLPGDPLSIKAPALNGLRRFSVKARILRHIKHAVNFILIIGAKPILQLFNAGFYGSHGSPPSGAGRTMSIKGFPGVGGLFIRAQSASLNPSQ
jgi:hypothetical protein